MKRTIKLNVLSPETQESFPLIYALSTHAADLISSRSISTIAIKTALLYGSMISKQGLSYYLLQENRIPEDYNASLSPRNKNLVVITDDNSGTIVTCYRARSGFKNIRKKRKELLRA